MNIADKFLKYDVDIEEFARELFSKLPFGDVMPRNIIEALNMTIAPTLTEDERVILRNIDKKIKYITRDNSGYLYITEQSFSMLALPFSIYNHLFQFIKERRRI